MSDSKEKTQRLKNLQTFNVEGEVNKIDTFKNELNENCFIYTTSNGLIGIKDIRSKSSALTYNIGKERGIISSLIMR